MPAGACAEAPAPRRRRHVSTALHARTGATTPRTPSRRKPAASSRAVSRGPGPRLPARSPHILSTASCTPVRGSSRAERRYIREPIEPASLCNLLMKVRTRRRRQSASCPSAWAHRAISLSAHCRAAAGDARLAARPRSLLAIAADSSAARSTAPGDWNCALACIRPSAPRRAAATPTDIGGSYRRRPVGVRSPLARLAPLPPSTARRTLPADWPPPRSIAPAPEKLLRCANLKHLAKSRAQMSK